MTVFSYEQYTVTWTTVNIMVLPWYCWFHNSPILLHFSIIITSCCDLNVHELSGIHGVFKKRLNFLNSAPTSTGSTLRLLSAPNGRFWQQTAICLVSLWPLVTELHPPNWACAQAVRRISDKVTLWKSLKNNVCVCESLLQTWQKFYRDISIA